MGVRDYESKTKAKSASHDLQKLGKRLAELPLSTLKTFDLPEQLYDAFEELTRTRGHEGTRRQFQYIGKIMRNVDAEPIEAKFGLVMQSTAEAKAFFKRCEQWRDQMLADPSAVNGFCAGFPAAKADVLARLITEARSEITEKKPPKHSRLLFRAVQSAITDSAEKPADE